MKKTTYIVLLILILIHVTTGILHAESFDYKKIYQLRGPSVVVVMALRKNGVGSVGTGSVIRQDGLVITNAHVIIDDTTNLVYPNLFIYLKPEKITGDRKEDLRHRYKARVIKYSNDLDLALLKIVSPPGKLPAIPFANPDSVEIGDPVLAIGHPERGGLWTLTTGVISTRVKNFEGIQGKDVFQTETSFNRGNSGGHLINLQGEMVGINSNIARKGAGGIAITDINFSITSGVAKKWLDRTGNPVAYALPQEKAEPKSKKVELSLEEYPAIAPKPEKKSEPEQPPVERKKLWARGTQLTPKRPYRSKDLMRIENEMEDMLKKMRKKFR